MQITYRSLRARVLAAVSREPAPTRRTLRWRALAWWSGALAVMALLFAAAGGPHLCGRPPALAWATSFGALAATLLGVQLVVARGPTMLPRPRAVIVLRSLLLLAALSAWKLAWSSAHDRSASAAEPPVLACLLLTLAMGAPQLAAALARRKDGGDLLHPALTGLGLGTVAGLGAWAVVDLLCPLGDPAHVLLAHALPVVLLAAAGAVAGSRLLAPHRSARAPPRPGIPPRRQGC